VDSTPSPPDQPPPWSPRPCQFGALPFQLCLKPRPVSVHLVEHGGDIPRHADLISPVIPSLECRSRRPDQLVDAVGQGDAVWRRPLVGVLQPDCLVEQQVVGRRHAER
jgi:hypothetical protein